MGPADLAAVDPAFWNPKPTPAAKKAGGRVDQIEKRELPGFRRFWIPDSDSNAIFTVGE